MSGRLGSFALVGGTILTVALVLFGFHHVNAGNPRDASTGSSSRGSDASTARVVKLPRLAWPVGAHVMVIGDSWSTGYAAAPGKGYMDILASRFGWRVDNVPDAPSSGWEYPGPGRRPGTFASRLAKQPVDTSVDLMFMHGGLNDQQVVRNGAEMSTDFNASVRAAMKLVRKKYPRAKVVVMGPLMPVKNYEGIIPEIDDRLLYEAAVEKFYYISPYTEGWIATNAQKSKYINHRASDHPNTAGHRLIAARAAQHLERFRARGQRHVLNG